MSNLGRFEQMNSEDSFQPNENKSFPLHKYKPNSTQSFLVKHFLYILILCLALFSFVFYLSVSRSFQVKANKEVLLEIESKYKQIKAQENDYEVQIKRMNQDVRGSTKEKKGMENAIDTTKKENEEIQKKITDVEKQKQYYKDEIKKLSDLKSIFEESIKLYNDIATLQEDIKSVRFGLNKMYRQLTDKREEGSQNLAFLSKDKDEDYIRDQIKSSIITTQNQANLLVSWLGGKDYILILEPCYRMAYDGYSVSTFHLNCDGVGNTITLFKVNNNNVFGGYTQQTWEGNGYKSDSKAFVFNLSSQKKYPVGYSQYAIYAKKTHFPSFGDGDLTVWGNDAKSSFPFSYGTVNDPKNELTLGLGAMRFEDIEVLRVSFGQ